MYNIDGCWQTRFRNFNISEIWKGGSLGHGQLYQVTMILTWSSIPEVNSNSHYPVYTAAT